MEKLIEFGSYLFYDGNDGFFKRSIYKNGKKELVVNITAGSKINNFRRYLSWQ
ncbi:MAG: hypothetical protein O6702_02385 [Candidatus Dadabacteria bacterium]|nr:hypothetical protein [Candidatus Dadabacteria bacterium]